MTVLSLAAVLILPFSASAAAPSDKANQIVAKANQKIETQVEQAQYVCDTLLNSGASDSSVQIENQIFLLKQHTDAVVAQTERKLERMGVEYECTYYSVSIGGHTVLIDPFLCVA